jgi:hypothetical protein
MTDLKTTVLKWGTIIIHRGQDDGYKFHPLDLSIEDRMKMIRALSTTSDDMVKGIFGDEIQR